MEDSEETTRRYDNPRNPYYQTIWACIYCHTCLLSQKANDAHQLLCKNFTPEVVKRCKYKGNTKKHRRRRALAKLRAAQNPV